jgi:hypothetical protein
LDPGSEISVAKKTVSGINKTVQTLLDLPLITWTPESGGSSPGPQKSPLFFSPLIALFNMNLKKITFTNSRNMAPRNAKIVKQYQYHL